MKCDEKPSLQICSSDEFGDGRGEIFSSRLVLIKRLRLSDDDIEGEQVLKIDAIFFV